MTEHYPRLRFYTAHGDTLFREGVSIHFYMSHAHPSVAQAVLSSLEAYLRAIGPSAIGFYVDAEGESQKLDAAGWKFTQEKLLHPVGARARLDDAEAGSYRYRFEYHGHSSNGSTRNESTPRLCVVSFWLPTEFLEEHGPERVRELALELARPLPFCSGHAGLSFNGETDPLSRSDAPSEWCFRYPGVEMIHTVTLTSRLGMRLRGASWLTFLGPPVLDELGGVAGLRSRLSSPGTHVEELEPSRAVVTLGLAPEAGDTEQGQFLPAYRELARILEPWLYHDPLVSRHDPDWLRWERRFLD